MTLKQKSFREKEHDKQKGKRRYRERLIEDQEAENEIKEYDRHEPIEREENEHPEGLANSN